VLFLAYPVLGPRQLTPGLQIERLGGGRVEPLALAYQNTLLLKGAAFPSAHVAATVAVLLGIWTWRRAFFWVAALLGFSIIIATVYLGYHYVLDVGAGALIGAVAFRFDGWTTAPGPDVRS
jgi:membrane-associated phospholipid phosphatase